MKVTQHPQIIVQRSRHKKSNKDSVALNHQIKIKKKNNEESLVFV